MRASAVVASVFVVFFASSGCGSGGTTGGGGSDGKFHPPTNGKAIDEATACGVLVGAIQARFQALSCVGTTRQCPDFLRVQFGTCFEYDEGTVQGCAAHYAGASTCDDLTAAIDDCVVVAIDGSGGQGCP